MNTHWLGGKNRQHTPCKGQQTRDHPYGGKNRHHTPSKEEQTRDHHYGKNFNRILINLKKKRLIYSMIQFFPKYNINENMIQTK